MFLLSQHKLGFLRSAHKFLSFLFFNLVTVILLNPGAFSQFSHFTSSPVYPSVMRYQLLEWNTPTSHSSSLCGTLDCERARLRMNKPWFNIECGCETYHKWKLVENKDTTLCVLFISVENIYA